MDKLKTSWYPILGYAKWQTFENVLSKAREACSNAGIEVFDHFTDASKMVGIGSGAKKDIIDLMRWRKYEKLVTLQFDRNI